MSLDANGVLYAASAYNVIYRLFPWSNDFELFAGTIAPSAVAAKPADPLSSDIKGPISAIDAIGTAEKLYFVDEGKRSVQSISTAKDGKIVSEQYFNVETPGLRFIASFTPTALILVSGTKFSTVPHTWGDTSAKTQIFHPRFTRTIWSPKSPLWYHRDGKTFSGFDSAVLSSNRLFPLATLADGFTICAKIETLPRAPTRAYIGVIRTEYDLKGLHSMQSDLYDLENYCALGKIDPAGRFEFLFCPATNMLYTWNGADKSLKRYYSVISPHTLKLLDIHESAYSSPQLTLDLSSLRPTLLSHDLTLEHALSGQTWKIHKDILLLHFEDHVLAKLPTLIRSTNIPASSISAFIDFIYLKPLAVGDWLTSVVELSHIIFLCEALGDELSPDAYVCADVHALFKAQIDAHMSPAEAADMLLDFWLDSSIDWTIDSSVIRLLINKVVVLSEPERYDLLQSCKRPASDASRALVLGMELATTKPSPEPIQGCNALNRDLPSPTSRILIDPKRALQHQTDFIFGASHHWTIAKGWVLYPRWSWFKKLINSGMEESKTRVVSMPPWVTVNIMHAIIKTVYQQNTGSVPLSEEEMILILEKGSEIGLVDSSKYAITPFEPLVARCVAMILLPGTVTKETCLDMLKVYHRLQLEAGLDTTLRFIKGIKDDLPLLKLDPELRKLIKDDP